MFGDTALSLLHILRPFYYIGSRLVSGQSIVDALHVYGTI